VFQPNGISLHVEDHGSGKPVVLLHGWPDSSYPWRNQIPFLVANDFRAIAPDQRGFGRSDRPEGVAAYSLENVVADVADILDALGIETADIVGHDWGAAVAWLTATEHPNRIHRLVVLSVGHPLAPRTLRQREMGWCQSVVPVRGNCGSVAASTTIGRYSGNCSEAMVTSIVTSRICHGATL
jgi:pimeloyl-ACP methyl ester carboxylesterase